MTRPPPNPYLSTGPEQLQRRYWIQSGEASMRETSGGSRARGILPLIVAMTVALVGCGSLSLGRSAAQQVARSFSIAYLQGVLCHASPSSDSAVLGRRDRGTVGVGDQLVHR